MAGAAAAAAALPIGAVWSGLATAQSAPRGIGGQYAIGTRKLGSLEVSGLAYGCMPNTAGPYGPGVDRAPGTRVFLTACAPGIRFFPTAAAYGPSLH